MGYIRQKYIYVMLLMAFSIALFPIGTHLEMCSNEEGHCHVTLNFCGVGISHHNTNDNYNSMNDHTSCNSSAMFHNTELISDISTNHKTNHLDITVRAAITDECKIRTKFITCNIKDYIDCNFHQYPQIIRSTILII